MRVPLPKAFGSSLWMVKQGCSLGGLVENEFERYGFSSLSSRRGAYDITNLTVMCLSRTCYTWRCDV